QWFWQPVVLPVERRVVTAPHLVCDLEQLLKTLKPLGQRWEGDAQTGHLMPTRPRLSDGEIGRDVEWRAGTNAEHHSASRQHIERRHGLDQDARMAIRDRRHHGA